MPIQAVMIPNNCIQHPFENDTHTVSKFIRLHASSGSFTAAHSGTMRHVMS